MSQLGLQTRFQSRLIHHRAGWLAGWLALADLPALHCVATRVPSSLDSAGVPTLMASRPRHDPDYLAAIPALGAANSGHLYGGEGVSNLIFRRLPALWLGGYAHWTHLVGWYFVQELDIFRWLGLRDRVIVGHWDRAC